MYTKNLHEKGLIHPPDWLPLNIHYEVIMGSECYGVALDTSDKDIYGWCIPAKEYVFPHVAGYIHGFDDIPKFEQFQQHHIKDTSEKCEYDITIYSIIKYFKLVMQNNPNMIDSLFVPVNCITHITQVGQMVRDERKSFLHKGSWHRFKGYSFQQLHKLKNKNKEGVRKEDIEKYGYSLKFAYHLVRLLLEIRQILEEGDLDLQRNKEKLSSIRRGEWSEERIIQFFEEQERDLELLYNKSNLPYGPDVNKIRTLLLKCLEHHYGSLEKSYMDENKMLRVLRKIQSDIGELNV